MKPCTCNMIDMDGTIYTGECPRHDLPTAKQKMIDDMQKYIDDNEDNLGFATQGNVIFARGELEKLKTKNLMQCQRAMNKIEEANKSQEEGAAKYGWGVEEVHPTNYLYFFGEE